MGHPASHEEKPDNRVHRLGTFTPSAHAHVRRTPERRANGRQPFCPVCIPESVAAASRGSRSSFDGMTPMWKKAIVAVLLLSLAALMAVAVSAFLRARSTPASNSCINILRRIDGATQQWAVENHKTTNDTPAWPDVLPYSGYEQIPACPQGGTYTLGRLNTLPRCSYPGHALPQ